MNKKLLIISVLAVFVLCVGFFTFSKNNKQSTSQTTTPQSTQPLTQEDEYQIEMDTEANLPQE